MSGPIWREKIDRRPWLTQEIGTKGRISCIQLVCFSHYFPLSDHVVVCFSALETMPPPRAMPPPCSPCRKKKRRHSLCWTCNVCNKCYPTFVGLNIHLSKHYGLYGPATSAELAKTRMSIPTITGAQLQAGTELAAQLQRAAKQWPRLSTAAQLQRAQLQRAQLQAGLHPTPTSAQLQAAGLHTSSTPRQSTPVPSPPMKKGKSVYFLLCYFSFWEMSPISHRNESHFPLFNEK